MPEPVSGNRLAMQAANDVDSCVPTDGLGDVSPKEANPARFAMPLSTSDWVDGIPPKAEPSVPCNPISQWEGWGGYTSGLQ